MKTTILFDFDGTLANTLSLVIFCFKEVFRKYTGADVTDVEILAMFGPPEEEMIRKAVPKNRLQDAIALYYKLYEHHHAQLVEEDESVARMIRTLHNEGYNLGICTGKGRRSMDISHRFLPFCDLFDVIVTGDDVAQPKPDPEGILTCLGALHSTPETAIYVGGSNSDIRAGGAVGMTTIGARWMADPQSRGYDTQPDYVFGDVDAFLRTIRSLF